MLVLPLKSRKLNAKLIWSNSEKIALCWRIIYAQMDANVLTKPYEANFIFPLTDQRMISFQN